MCSFHPLSQNLLFAQNGDHHRKPKLDTMKRLTACGKLIFNAYIYNTASALMDWGTLQK